MTLPQRADEPKWLAPVSYLAALPVVVVLVFLRDEPWTKGSFGGLVLAGVMAGSVVYLSAKKAVGLPLSSKRSPYDRPSDSWLDRGWGIVFQLAIVGCAGAALALFF